MKIGDKVIFADEEYIKEVLKGEKYAFLANKKATIISSVIHNGEKYYYTDWSEKVAFNEKWFRKKTGMELE